MLVYEMPLNEIIYDFFDVLKSRSRGYASFDYSLIGYKESDLIKLDILAVSYTHLDVYKRQPLETAYREVYEELGIKKENIRILGQPDFIITHSGFIIMPFLGYVEGLRVEQIKYSTDEVESIFTVPLNFFKNHSPKSSYLHLSPYIEDDFPVEMIPNGKEYKFASAKVLELFYQYKEFIIWGITARIARNVCSIIEKEE